jgi:tocopherol O-methyltransferase
MIESNLPICSEDVAGHYDELDPYYRRLWGDHLHHGLWVSGRESPRQAIEQLIDHVADQLQLPTHRPEPSRLPDRSSQVCDVGCGYGGTSRYLAASRGWQMTGLTISARQHAYAEQQAADAGNPRFLLRNWEQNQLEERSFDGLLSIECVSHVVDKQRFFAEISRVLKPGRRAAVIAWLCADGASRMADYWLLEPICREGRLPSMGDAGDYRQLAEAAGLNVLSCEDLTRQVRRTWRICLGRVAHYLTCTRDGWRFLLGAKSRHAVFAVTVARILAAYYSGAMKYGLFVLEKPA